MRWTKARWVVVGASLGRGRQARTIDEARALVHSVRQFAAHRPCGRDLPARADEAVEQRVPARGRRALPARLLLLVRVVHGHRHVRVGAVAYPVEDGVEAVHEELGGVLLPVVAVGVRHELLGLRREHGGDHRGMDVQQAAPQPHVEEVGEVGVTDIVVIGRIRGHHQARVVPRVSTQLPGTPRTIRRDTFDSLGDPFELAEEIPRGMRKRIRLGDVPCHGNSLAGEKMRNCFPCRMPRA